MSGHPFDAQYILLSPNDVIPKLNPNVVSIVTTRSHLDLNVQIFAEARTRPCYSIDARDEKLAIFAMETATSSNGSTLVFTITKKTTDIGPALCGKNCKVPNHITIRSNLFGLSEGLVFAKRAGLDLGKFPEAIIEGAWLNLGKFMDEFLPKIV